MKKYFIVFLAMVAVVVLTACKPSERVQGVTDTEIVVGNTAATSGAFATVGVPFNAAIQAVFDQVNAAGGIDGRTIRFITYDDGFDAAQGTALTERLVEEDEVFALVGHFGTPTVGATLDYIQEYGVPMVYAATGINALYFQESVGNPVLAVQPIYRTDGRLMLARALKENLYGPNETAPIGPNPTIGVLYTNDDVGNSIKAGILEEAAIHGLTSNIVEAQLGDTSTTTAAVQNLKDAGVSVIVIAANQTPFGAAVNAMHDAALNVPVFTSYVNADISVIPASLELGFNIYTNAWVDVFSEKGTTDVLAYVETINASARLTAEEKVQYAGNSFAIAGYIAATIFVDGLRRLEGKEVTWNSFIAAMEEAPFSVPMGGTVDFTDGKRWGIASMSLLRYTRVVEDENVTQSFAKIREIETLEEIQNKD